MATPTFTLPTSGSDPKVATKEGLEENINQIIQYLDNARISGDAALMTGLEFQGGWDASTGLFPDQDIDGNPLTKGDFFWVSDEGTFGGVTYSINEPLIAVVDSPSTTDTSDWYHAPLNPALVPLTDSIDEVTGRVDNLGVPFNTKEDFFLASIEDIKAAANKETGNVYVEVLEGNHTYSLDLSQSSSFDWSTDGGVEINYIKGNSGVWNLDSFTTVGMTGDITTALQRAVSIMDPREKLVLHSGGRYTVSAEIAITEPIHIDGQGALIRPASGYTGYMMSVEGTRRGISDLYWEHPSEGNNIPDRSLGDNNGFQLHNLIFEGLKRQQVSNGIIFRGGNSDLLLRGLEFYGLKGCAMAACDPDGATGEDAVNQYIQESDFQNIHAKNCGDVGVPIMWVGRNNSGNSNHNNLRLDHVFLIYPRGGGALRVKNNNTSTSNGNIQTFQMDKCFLHGNVSLVPSDNYGESTEDNNHVLSIEASSATNSGRIIRPSIRNCRIVEQESTFAAVNLENVEETNISGGHITAAASRYGIQMDGTTDVAVSHVAGLEGEDAFRIGTFKGGSRLTVNGLLVGYAPSMTAPNLSFTGSSDLTQIVDDTSELFSYDFAGDLTPSDTTDVTTFGYSQEGAMLLEAWFVPDGTLTANDTNYAIISIRPYNTSGTARPVQQTTTQTSGTGNWSDGVRVPLDLAEGTKMPARLAFSITKQGSGVTVPKGKLFVRTSKQLYLSTT